MSHTVQDPRLPRYLNDREGGISSRTIIRALAHPYLHGVSDVPYDPSDFRRCLRLLAVMPEWRARLPEVAAKYPTWAGLVEHWDELEALYEEEAPSGVAPKLFARMQELIG